MPAAIQFDAVSIRVRSDDALEFALIRVDCVFYTATLYQTGRKDIEAPAQRDPSVRPLQVHDANPMIATHKSDGAVINCLLWRSIRCRTDGRHPHFSHILKYKGIRKGG